MIYLDRHSAGRKLAAELGHLRHRGDVVVLALPRGGVPVAVEVATALAAPLDVFLVRKLGLPGRAELAMGAIASGGVRVDNPDVIGEFAVPAHEIERIVRIESAELRRREELYRAGRMLLGVAGKIAVLVDDGLATGATMRAAVLALRQHRPERIVVAVPVGAPETCTELASLADEVICPLQPADFRAVGSFYRDFGQTTDEEVKQMLANQGKA